MNDWCSCSWFKWHNFGLPRSLYLILKVTNQVAAMMLLHEYAEHHWLIQWKVGKSKPPRKEWGILLLSQNSRLLCVTVYRVLSTVCIGIVAYEVKLVLLIQMWLMENRRAEILLRYCRNCLFLKFIVYAVTVLNGYIGYICECTQNVEEIEWVGKRNLYGDHKSFTSDQSLSQSWFTFFSSDKCFIKLAMIYI